MEKNYNKPRKKTTLDGGKKLHFVKNNGRPKFFPKWFFESKKYK